MIYILVRTSNRPEYFRRCIHSIETQVYSGNVEIVVGNDNNDDYCKRYRPVKFDRDANWDWHKAPAVDTARQFPFNGYLNKMLQRCTKQGWVIILDDDDMLKHKYVLRDLDQRLVNDNQVAFWRVDLKGNIIPSDLNFGKRPVKRDLSMIGFAFNTKYIPLIYVAPYKQADWRLADQLYSWCEPVFINEILTYSTNEGRGAQKDAVI